ncbi:hypothetical protein [Streptomyces sp. NPDC006879]|uniref:hypothetical protein n=1 Tax=Streptomyces sp. NPDC006879 TaxID=3364767 RepID=UPI003680139E
MTFPPQPPLPKASDVQLTPRLLERAAHSIGLALDHADKLLGRGLDGRGKEQDIAAIKDGASGPTRDARLRLYELLHETAELAQSSALDHLRALPADLTRDPRPTFSHLTLARVAMEAGGMFAYLTDRDVDVRELIARVAGIQMADVDTALRFAESHTERPDLVAAMQETEQELLALFQAAGVTHRRNKRGQLSETELDGHKTSGDMAIGKAARAFLGHDAHDPYNLLSGGAHSRPWLLRTGRETPPDGGSVLYLLWFTKALLTAWLERWAAYTGAELDPPIAKVVQGITITIQRAAEGDFNTA